MNAVSEEVAGEAHETQGTATATVVAVPKTKSKAKVQQDDLLVQIVQEIGNLDATQAIEAVPALLNSADENYFRLGGVFSAISKQEFYKSAGFENFKTFVEQTYGIAYRKAMYWIQIYEALIESGVSWNKVSAVGWTKLKDLAPILTLENVDEWVKRALSSTVLQLQEAIKQATAGTLPNSGITPTDDEESKVTTLTFKVHADQKVIIKEAVAKACKEANTEFDGVALEALCMNYLSGPNVNKPVSLDETMKKFSVEDILKALEQAYPEFEITAKFKKN